MRLEIVLPRCDAGFYFGTGHNAWHQPRASMIYPDLAGPTVAALVPPEIDVAISDENAGLDYTWQPTAASQVVAISVKSYNTHRALELARACRDAGRIVLMGGPQISIQPEAFQDECHALVVGELENIAPQLFDDLLQGRLRSRYEGGLANMALSPTPRWDLYPCHRYGSGVVEISRGCRNDCEFCQSVRIHGHLPRVKSTQQVVAECEALRNSGFRSAFVVDDNIRSGGQAMVDVLEALARWRHERPENRLRLTIQTDLVTADDPKLLDLLARAGVTMVFLGVESPCAASLRQARKFASLGEQVGRIQMFYDHGLQVRLGMILGFDGEPPDIVERQAELARAAAVPMVISQLLHAPQATPLHRRLAAQNRLTAANWLPTGDIFATNIVPQRGSQAQLQDSLALLLRRLYHPEAFCRRLLDCVDRLRPMAQPVLSGRRQRSDRQQPDCSDGLRMVRDFVHLGTTEAAAWQEEIVPRIVRQPSLAEPVQSILFSYVLLRQKCAHMGLDLWPPV